MRPDADTIDTREWVLDVATAHRLLEEIGPASEPLAERGPRGDRSYFAWMTTMADHLDAEPGILRRCQAQALARLAVAVRAGTRESVPS